MSAQPLGIDSALSRIQQIQSYQQQLLDPSAMLATATSSSGSTGAAATSTGNTTATSSGSGTDFATLLASLENTSSAGSDSAASATGTDADAGTDFDRTADTSASALSALATSNPSLLSALAAGGTTSVNAATSLDGTAAAGTGAAAPPAVQSMLTEANSLIGKPYVWGGGHSGWGAQTGYDCSGFVSAVLHAGGYLATPQDTVGLAQSAGIESGPGQYVTIYDRTDAGIGSDHVIINLDGQFYESGGAAGTWGGGGGVEKIATPSAAYLASFNRVLHPAGL